MSFNSPVLVPPYALTINLNMACSIGIATTAAQRSLSPSAARMIGSIVRPVILYLVPLELGGSFALLNSADHDPYEGSTTVAEVSSTSKLISVGCARSA